MKFLLFTAIALLAGTVAPAQTDTIRWTILMSGNKAGYYKQLKNADGSYTEWYKYNDRGRGDSTVSHYRKNAAGYITWLDASGVDYFKRPVHETFSVENGTASWENRNEQSQQTVTGEVEYVPLSVTAGTTFKPYFGATDQTVMLIPSGTRKLVVHVEKAVGERKLRLISQSGVDITPAYYWIDESDEFFGALSSWMSTIRSGYEDQVNELLATQQSFEQQYFREIAATVRHTVKTGIALTNATAFDPRTGIAKPKSVILIDKGRIEIVSAKAAIPNTFRVIDLENKFVMPGLWDMHVHYGDATDGLLHLANGITNVRDMANGEDLLESRKAIDDGVVLGPRIQAMCGFIDGAGPYAGPTGAKITSAEEGIAAVQHYKGLGYTQIKLYSSLNPEWVKPIAAEAHRLGLRVSGHIPAHMLASEALDAGYDEIQHMNMLFLNFLSKDLDTRTSVRFHAVAQNAANLNLESAEVKAFLKKLKEKKTVIDPTVSLFETMFVPQDRVPTMAAVVNRLPVGLQRNFKSDKSLAIPEGQQTTYAASFDRMLQFVKLLYDNNITIVPGTDGFPGFALHKELENYVRAGIPNAAVLRIATLQSAVVAGREKEYGSLEAGKVADIIVIDGDPLKNISDIRKVEMVIKGQDVYQTKELLNAISIKYFE